MNIDYLNDYFKDTSPITRRLDYQIGMEIETSFINKTGNAVTKECSQQILRKISESSNNNWVITEVKKEMITELQNRDGSRILYELGRQNIELSVSPYNKTQLIERARQYLGDIYQAAQTTEAIPYFGPILETEEDLLIIPDERDASWLKLDGSKALNLLAKCSSVQFTFNTTYNRAPIYLNKLQEELPQFLKNYPQDKLWREYIQLSPAGYLADRYGGPNSFDSVYQYCKKLTKHDVVRGERLIAQNLIGSFDINLFLRSVWWYFRLRRYYSEWEKANVLCIEVRPLPRLNDSELKYQLEQVFDIIAA